MTLVIIGSTTLNVRWKKFAPSIRAASNTLGSMDDIPPRMTMVCQPMEYQVMQNT